MGLAGQQPHETGQELCSQPLSPEREDDLSLHLLSLRRAAKKCSWFSQCLIETSPQSAPSSLCTVILGHDQALGSLCLYTDHRLRSVP